MAARSRVRRTVKRHRDLVWITTLIEASLLESTPTDIGQLVIPADWSGGNAGFDRCTLMGVRGWLGYAQLAAATAADATALFLAMYVTDGQVTLNSMDPSLATEYAVFDTIWTDGYTLSSNTGTSASQLSRQLDIKSKRKLTTAQELRLAASIPADTGTPRANITGCIRCLLMLDPG